MANVPSELTMPGRGRTVERPHADVELAAFREGRADLGLSYDQLTACLGGACYDVYLNDVGKWRGGAAFSGPSSRATW